METLKLIPQYRYTVYEHKQEIDGELVRQRMIALKHIDGVFPSILTGLEFYSYPYTGQEPFRETRTNKSELHYICQALNYICPRYHIQKLNDVNYDMIVDFFDSYCNTPKKHNPEAYLSQQSLDRCIRAVTNFFANLTVFHKTKCNVEDLCREVYVKDTLRSARKRRVFIPAYRAKRHHSADKEILRDIPLSAAVKLVNLAYVHDPMIAFAIVLQMFAGLRPSEAMNVRQADSPLAGTPGITCKMANGKVNKFKIDLQKELLLRSDGVHVGNIKKEREVLTFPGFLRYIFPAYQRHLLLLNNYPVEENFKPMFVLENGKAMTYPVYVSRVRKLINQHLKPLLRESADEREVVFARELDSRKLAPHAFRHVFTVMLVLLGLNAGDIQKYRGDSSPESALEYMKNKGELMLIVKNIHESALLELKELDLNDNIS